MTVYTGVEAQGNLEALLSEARRRGEVLIRLGDGQEFVVRPVLRQRSPLDVDSIVLSPPPSIDEINSVVREVRERQQP